MNKEPTKLRSDREIAAWIEAFTACLRIHAASGVSVDPAEIGFEADRVVLELRHRLVPPPGTQR